MITELIGSLLQQSLQPLVSGFNWFHFLPGIGDGALGRALHLRDPADGWVVPAAWFTVALVLGLAMLARMGLNRAMAREGTEKFIPDSGLSPRNLMEMLVESYQGLVEGVLGTKETPNFFPFIATLFLYTVVSNFLGLIPGNAPVTGNFSSNLAMSLCVFVMFNWAGLTRNGFAYIKHLWGPILLMGFLLFPIEVFGLFLRPFSLTVRLTANMFADHMVSGAVRDVGGDMIGPIGKVLAPVPFYVLGAFVCLVQAFVYSLLSTVYAGLSTADMSHGHDDHDHEKSHSTDHA